MEHRYLCIPIARTGDDMVKRTSPLYHNRLFETEEAGRDWAERMAKKLPNATVKCEWRKIKYASPDSAEVFSVTFEEEGQGW